MSIFNSHRKYILLMPIIFLLFNGVYFLHTTRVVDNILLQEKIVNAQDIMNTLTAAADATKATDPEQFNEHTLMAAMEHIASIPLVYAAVFGKNDNNTHCANSLTLLSTKDYTTNFNPLEHDIFLDAVLWQDSGNVVINFTPEDMSNRDMHIYFHWTPMTFAPEERYLLTVGVSKYSIVNSIPLWVSAGQLINTIITFSLNLWLIILLVRLGYIYKQRRGQKWRDNREV